MSMKTDEPPSRARPSSPSFLSERFMIWAWFLVFAGRRRPLEKEDIPDLGRSLQAQPICRKVVTLWEAESQRKNPSLVRVILLSCRTSLICGIVASICHGLVVSVARPLLLRYVIRNVGQIELKEVVLLSVVLLLEGYLQLWVKQAFNERLCCSIIAGCTSLISKRIPMTAAVTDPSSKAPSEANLVSFDIIRMSENSMVGMYMVTAPVQLISSCVIVLYVVGLPGLFGLGFCVLSMCSGSVLTALNKSVDKAVLKQTDQRIALLKQILDGIRFIKTSGWEEFYLRKSTSIRAQETWMQRRYRTYEMLNITCGRITPPFAAMVTFVSMALLGKPMKAEDIFVVMSLFMSLRLPMGALPMVANFLVSAANSYARIGRELLRSPVVPPSNPDNPYLIASLRDVDLRWSPDAPLVLQGVTTDITWGQSVAVIGAVASGKSTLLLSLIDGLAPCKGVVSRTATCERLSYVPQRPLIFSGTVLSNVIMGNTQDDKELNAALDAAQFIRDLELMPAGLNTEIGERGTTLSGGQQMRLNVARALYNKPQLIVADDPLAAVDVHVASLIFAALQQWQRGAEAEQANTKLHPVVRAAHEEASTIVDIEEGIVAPGPLNGHSHTLVMSLNQLQMLSEFDQVIYLHGGSVAFQGSPGELDAAKKDHQSLASLIESANMAATCDSISDPKPDQSKANPLRLTMLPTSPSGPSGRKSTSSMASDGKLVKAEHRVRGAIGSSVFIQYLKAVGMPWLGAYISCWISSYGFLAAVDWYLAFWMKESQADGEKFSHYRAAAIYAGLAFAHGISMLSSNIVCGFAGAHASRNLHKLSLTSLLRAPMSWFEETPSGRTLSKFSTDLTGVDLKLPLMLDHTNQIVGALTVLTIGICVIVPWLIIFLVIVAPMYMRLDALVNNSSREIKRMSNMAISPVLTLVQEASTARLLVRVMQQEDWLHDQTIYRVDEYNRLFYTSMSMMGFLRVNGAVLGAVISILVLIFISAFPSLAQSAPGGSAAVGLALVYSFLIPYFLSFLSMFSSGARLFLAGLERLFELQSERMPEEKPWCCKGDPEQLWPDKGMIEFQGATLRYRADLDPAICDFTLTISGGERLGVVGRTGAGKSSLSVLLLRIVEPDSGTLRIDGRDICQVGLHVLRQAVAVVPQEPFLFQGPLRQNLDPLHLHEDAALSHALSLVRVDMALDAEVGTGGGQLSAGERQLIAMARVTLSSARILIMDEPTANCDAETDDRLQQVTREAFKSRTVLCIAHRLNTVMEYDRILVMDAGTLAEVDTPANLLKIPGGHFAQMVSKMQGLSGAAPCKE